MVFNSRILPVFMLWLPKISGSSIVISINVGDCHRMVLEFQLFSSQKLLLPKNEVALGYHRVYFLAVLFAAIIDFSDKNT